MKYNSKLFVTYTLLFLTVLITALDKISNCKDVVDSYLTNNTIINVYSYFFVGSEKNVLSTWRFREGVATQCKSSSC